MKIIFNFLLFLLLCNDIYAQKDELGTLLDRLNKVQDKTIEKADILNQISWEYRNNNPRLGVTYGKFALDLAKELKYDKGINKSLSFIGVNYKNVGEHSKALEYFFEGIVENKRTKDIEAEGHSYNNIGEIYRLQKNYKQAEEYFQKALDAGTVNQNDILVAYAHNSFGKLYKDLKEYDKALDEHLKALEIRKRIKDKKAAAASIENISKIYEAQGKMEDAIKSYNQAYEFAKSFNDARGMATALIGIARIDLKLEKYTESEENAKKALVIVEKVGDKVYQKDSYEVLVNNAKAIKNYELTVKYQDKFLALQEEIYNDKLSKDINYLTKSFQDEQNKAHIDLLQQQQKNTYIVIALVVVGLILSSIFSVFLFRNNRKLNKTQDDLKSSMDTIAKKNEDIEASIRYASRIQKSFLPNRFELNVALPNNFIFYKPKNVVGGDFYFFREIDKKIFIAVADCTGHGVPGALLSIVGSMALQKVIVDHKVQEPNKILGEVHEEMRKALKQNQDGGGMEIAMCVIDNVKKTLEFASARMPIYIFQNNSLDVVEGERLMVGDTQVENIALQNHIYSLKDIKKIYMASDGMQDQFSSNNHKKFTKKSFKDILQQIQEKPIQLQGQELESILKSWQGTEPQTDDILVMGIEI
ncbi:hypothetical protein AD998_04870 [bacterium 336/3]|nr:hypothetical protein AD998_04870 [bacterium 336/3]